MKHAWLDKFLPAWALCSIAWVVLGFVLMPDAYRLPLFANTGVIWMPRMYDPTNIDWMVAGKLVLVLGPPIIVALLAAIVVAVQQVKYARNRPPPTFR